MIYVSLVRTHRGKRKSFRFQLPGEIHVTLGTWYWLVWVRGRIWGRMWRRV